MVNPRRPLPPHDRRLTGPTFTPEKFVEVMWDELRRFSYRAPADGALEAAWRPTLTILDLVRHRVEARGRRLVLTIYPSALQVHPDKRAALLDALRHHPRWAGLLPTHVEPELPNRILLDYCRRAGIACHDATPDLVAASRASPEPLYKERDTHWTARGNRVVAEAQARWLRGVVCP